MKKKFSIKKILLAILAVVVSLFALIIIIGPSEPGVITKEKLAEYNNKFSTINISGFEAKNLNGEKITSDILKNNKITMVNIFTTWCNPCIEEMPDIAKLHTNLPENSNIIGICVDAGDDDDTLKLAQKIMKKSNANFNVLIPDEVLKKRLLNLVNMYPTTIYIDSNGNIVGDIHSSRHTEEDYRKGIIQRLQIVQNKK
ncbi:TlpA family protein disulfide reductase [Clostridium sp. ZS2-4]|uniref:TlpA family protein disulfide reductase n=1 Tax=Clostridium sp. ZS2-4 TaxID=2987703 RepID=UPI00227BEF5F|nr:TlpA disulfide reductase family protein [Clostridium sp. ZS2-4]MCY6354233.1 TlpA disulfide reductase family protein [Clostridium sp. ZS2-4]